MRAEIIAIGDELTSGQRLDTNSPWLSERLVELGVDLAFHTTVGDDLDTAVAAFRTAIERADVVISTGGLGPTADDLTRDAIAVATGVDLVEDAAALEHIRRIFAKHGRTMPERNLLQAQFPRGSRPVPNQHGTAPGIEMTIQRPCCLPCRLFALPGVPAELFVMWADTLAPAILAAQTAQAGHRVTRHRRIKCFGAGESHLEAMLPDLIHRGREPRVGITVSDTTITLRITASGPNEAVCFRAMEPTVAQIRDLLGVMVFGEEEDELQHPVVRLLDERRMTVAVAEWATDGLVNHWLTDAAGASHCVHGGVVVHDAAMLVSLLGPVEMPDPSSAATAEALAVAVRKQAGADFGLAVAAWPSDGKLQIALAMGENVRVKGFPVTGHPAVLRTRAAKQALNMLRLALLNRVR